MKHSVLIEVLPKMNSRLLLKSSSTNESKKKSKTNKMTTLKEAKEIDDEEEDDTGITIKVGKHPDKTFKSSRKKPNKGQC